MELEIKRFDAPDETRAFDKGSFEVVEIGGMTIGRARYEPGWKWSEHVGGITGTSTCEVEHLGMVVSGHAAVAKAAEDSDSDLASASGSSGGRAAPCR